MVLKILKFTASITPNPPAQQTSQLVPIDQLLLVIIILFFAVARVRVRHEAAVARRRWRQLALGRDGDD